MARNKQHGFSLIELLITIAIMALLTVAILPMLGMYNRHDQTMADAQTVGSLLDQIRSYALNPEPGLCPVNTGQTLSMPINEYVLFVPSSPSGGNVLTTAPNPAIPGNTSYQCNTNNYPNQITLNTNQYAIEAVNYNSTTNTHYTLGIVSVGHLSNVSIFDSPDPNDAQSTNPRATMIGWQSPGGQFDSVRFSGTWSLSNYNYIPHGSCTIIGGVTMCPGAGYNNAVAESAKYSIPQNNIGGPADGTYVIISIGSTQDSYRVPVVVDITTGVVIGVGKLPSDFVLD